jgi:hypothetical protein
MGIHPPVGRATGILDPDELWRGLEAALDTPGRVDRVELKVLLDCRLEDAVSVLGAKVKPPVLRTIHYLDTPDRALSSRGVVVRTRVSRAADGAGEGAGDVAVGDVVVKVRRPRPHRRQPTRRLPVELDALPADLTWSASTRRQREPDRIRAALTRARPGRHLLSRSQRALVRSVAGPGVDDELVALGPVEVVKLRSAKGSRSAECGSRISIEAWSYPDGTHIVELSAKCRPDQSPRLAEAVRQLITDHGIALSGRQSSKTHISLQRLSGADAAAYAAS